MTLFAFSVGGMAGCASQAPAGGGVLDRALDLVGLQSRPSLPDTSSLEAAAAARAPKRITLRIHAGEVLNSDPTGRSLSLVLRVYKLRDANGLLRAPAAAFADDSRGKASPVDGVVEVREIVLTPGQRYEVIESLPPEAAFLGVVGLFRAPDEKRWRFVFDAAAASASGITLGAHGCALSVAEGRPSDAPAETLRLAGVRCR